MSMTPKQRRLLIVLGIPAAILLCAFALLPALARPSNCGGNSAALAACKTVAACFRVIGSERGDQPVEVTSLNAQEREYFEQIAGLGWLGDAKVLVITSAVAITEQGSNTIIAVCDGAFDNVPRRFLGKSPLRHAVAYADGSTRLIPVEEFRKLDLAQFVDVTTISEKKVEPDASPEPPPRAASSEAHD
jgi:hypothetical protein